MRGAGAGDGISAAVVPFHELGHRWGDGGIDQYDLVVPRVVFDEAGEDRGGRFNADSAPAQLGQAESVAEALAVICANFQKAPGGNTHALKFGDNDFFFVVLRVHV